MHHKARNWAKGQGVKWTTRFRSRAPRKKEKKIVLPTKGQKGLSAPSSWLRAAAWINRFLHKLPFMPNLPTGESRVVCPNTEAAMQEIRKGKEHRRFATNKIQTHKYNPFTFLPVNLYQQFKRVANMWFLLVAILQVGGKMFADNCVGHV